MCVCVCVFSLLCECLCEWLSAPRNVVSMRVVCQRESVRLEWLLKGCGQAPVRCFNLFYLAEHHVVVVAGRIKRLWCVPNVCVIMREVVYIQLRCGMKWTEGVVSVSCIHNTCSVVKSDSSPTNGPWSSSSATI